MNESIMNHASSAVKQKLSVCGVRSGDLVLWVAACVYERPTCLAVPCACSVCATELFLSCPALWYRMQTVPTAHAYLLSN
jgi:hypothetical protein